MKKIRSSLLCFFALLNFSGAVFASSAGEANQTAHTAQELLDEEQILANGGVIVYESDDGIPTVYPPEGDTGVGQVVEMELGETMTGEAQDLLDEEQILANGGVIVYESDDGIPTVYPPEGYDKIQSRIVYAKVDFLDRAFYNNASKDTVYYKIPSGKLVEVISSNVGNNMCKVKYLGREGYMQKNHLVF